MMIKHQCGGALLLCEKDPFHEMRRRVQRFLETAIGLGDEDPVMCARRSAKHEVAFRYTAEIAAGNKIVLYPISIEIIGALKAPLGELRLAFGKTAL